MGTQRENVVSCVAYEMALSTKTKLVSFENFI